MSVQAISWALEHQIVADAGARHVLVALANHADNTGRDAYPSVSLLCRYTGLKRRTVLDKLKLLQDVGVVVRGNQRIAEAKIRRAARRPVVYDIRIDLGFDSFSATDERERKITGMQGLHPAESHGMQVLHLVSMTGCKCLRSGVQILHPNRP